MSQSQNAIQEPSMDELLASIREIIEENGDVSSAEVIEQAVESEVCDLPRQVNNLRHPAGKYDAHSTIKNSNGVPVLVQDAMNALAERIGLRKPPLSSDNKSEAMIVKPPMATKSVQPHGAIPVKESKLEKPKIAIRSQPQKQKNSNEIAQETNESEKAFQSDVERSAELLLRPYIAQWLDEHFRQLFERILREEIQRFIQALRR
ncbi:MAG: hypothetical protein JSC188_000741 [Candidatus Tokpelaia sp. JSC188]|nr:MAG: hypothetical protein JSC188_000741 [Candidatus Tokpelaia sp. JSC188]